MKVSKFLSVALVGSMLTGCVAHKYQVHFTPGSSQLSPASKATIMEAANILKDHKHGSIRLSGYTDGTGSSELNKQLAMKRIDTVGSMLNNYGIGDDRISRTTGHKWLFNDTSGENMSERRVDIRVFRW